MTNPEPAPWWANLTPDEVAELNELARVSPMPIYSYPYVDKEMARELLAWKDLEVDVMTAHADWLDGLKRRSESRGREWTHEEFLRVTRLREAGE